ncbi:MAG: HAMP domain-containing histidine kinase [Firmicutes bacterium]|nr:HAMP domain-containing histidine kinase [Bacillota bacterium]
MSYRNKSKMKLGTKLILYYLTTTLIFLLIIGFAVNTSVRYFGMSTVEDQLIEQTISSLDYIKQTIYFQSKFPDNITLDLSNEIGKNLSAGNRIIRLYDENLNLISSYIDGIRQSSFETKIMEDNIGDAFSGNYTYVSDGDNIYFAAPIILNEKTIGVFEIVYPLNLLNHILSKTTVVLLVAGILFSIFIIILSFYLARITVKPIKKLVYIAHQYAKQNFKHIDIEGPYEIQQLSGSLSKMGQKTQEYVNRQKQFVSNVSHELRTPLTAIKGYSDFLIDEVKGNEDLETAVYHLNNETERLTKMVNELLTLSRLDSEDEYYNMGKFNLTNLVKNVVDSMTMRAALESISLECFVDEKIYIIGDREKFSQVIINVIDNAIKYSLELQIVKISLLKDDNNVILEVKDRGIGIPENELDKIFHRFYRAQNTKSNKGTGLGLAIAKEIVEAHKGSIEIKSEQESGTIVTIILPISKQLLQD